MENGYLAPLNKYIPFSDQLHSLEKINLALWSIVEPIIFEEHNIDGHWIKAMEEELDQIEKNETWELVPRPKNKNLIVEKWVF